MMTAPQHVAGAATQEAGNVAGTAKDQAAQVVGTAAAGVSDVAATTKDHAANVVGESVDQVRDLAATVRTQVGEQVGVQGERLTSTLRSLSTQLHEGDTSGVVGQVMQEAGQRLERLAGYVERTGPQGLVTELRGYARRNPGSFLLGTALAGLVAGRVTKGIAANKSERATTLPPTYPAAYVEPYGTAAGMPLTGVTAPADPGRTAGYAPSVEPGISYVPEPVDAPSTYPPAYPAPTPAPDLVPGVTSVPPTGPAGPAGGSW